MAKLLDEPGDSQVDGHNKHLDNDVRAINTSIPGEDQKEPVEPSEVDANERQLRSFNPGFAHLGFAERIAHNVEAILAKPDRQRVLNALSCRELYLTKFPDAKQELSDVAITLQIVALRTICEKIMKLPAELRKIIYGFLIPEEDYRLITERNTFQTKLNEALRVTGDFISSLAQIQPQAAFDSDHHIARIEDYQIIGRDMHKELVFQHFESSNFIVYEYNPLGFPSLDGWNHGIDPRKTIKHFRLECTFLFWNFKQVADKKLKSLTNLIAPLLQHCRDDSHWVLDFRYTIIPGERQEYRFDADIQHLINRLSAIDTPYPEVIKVVCTDTRSRTKYEGNLDAWIDMYRQTGWNKGLGTFEQRLTSYQSLQNVMGRKTYDFKSSVWDPLPGEIGERQ